MEQNKSMTGDKMTYGTCDKRSNCKRVKKQFLAENIDEMLSHFLFFFLFIAGLLWALVNIECKKSAC